MLFSVPQSLGGSSLTLYAFCALILVSVSYVSFNVPYLAMLPEITVTPAERSVLASFRVYALAAAQFIAGGLAPLLIDAFGGGRAAYSGMSFVLGGLLVVAGLTCFFATGDAPRTALSGAAKQRFWSSMNTLFGSRLYLALVLVKATFLVGSTAHTVTATYYVRYVMQAPNSTLATFLLAYTLGMIASQVAWIALSKRIGKIPAFLVASGMYVTISVLWTLLGAGAATWLFIALSFLNGTGAGGLLLTSESLLPDAIEDDCLRSGTRREATLASMFAFAEKAANALGVAIIGFVLSAFGYRAPAPGESIPPEVVTAIMASFGFLPAAFVGASGAWWLLARTPASANVRSPGRTDGPGGPGAARVTGLDPDAAPIGRGPHA